MGSTDGKNDATISLNSEGEFETIGVKYPGSWKC